MPDDWRVIAVIAALGIAAVAAHLIDLFRWYVTEEPIVVDSQSNGGVRTSAWSGTR